MRRYLAIGAAAVALIYFLDPANGRRRRRAVQTWLTEAAQRIRDRMAAVPEEMPTETVGNGRPSVGEEWPETAEPEREPVREPVVIGVAAAEEPEEAPRPVAVAEAPMAEAVLPPPLPPDVLETPTPEPALEEPEPPAPAPRKRRWWPIGGAVFLVAALAAAGVAAFAFDVVEFSDDEPSSPSTALAALTQRQSRAISIMAQPGATRIPVVGAEERLLLIVGREGDAVLIVSRLERAPAGKTYEIWVISGKTPRPAGLFRGGRDTVVPLTRAVPRGATVALTVERVGGSPQPTSQPLFAVTRT
jgi:anti-sigma-K factor RskA